MGWAGEGAGAGAGAGVPGDGAGAGAGAEGVGDVEGACVGAGVGAGAGADSPQPMIVNKRITMINSRLENLLIASSFKKPNLFQEECISKRLRYQNNSVTIATPPRRFLARLLGMLLEIKK